MNISIRKLSETHLIQVIEISNACFGHNYIQLNYLSKRNDSRFNDFVVMKGELVVGFCLTDVVASENNTSEYLYHLNIKEYPIGVIKSIAIEPSYQNKRLGSMLLNHVIDFLFANKINSVVYPAWVENNRDYFLSKLKGLGFQSIKYFTNFWENESEQIGYSCIRCGLPPCKCSMNLYVLSLK